MGSKHLAPSKPTQSHVESVGDETNMMEAHFEQTSGLCVMGKRLTPNRAFPTYGLAIGR